MSGNKNLALAKKAKNDEFYTRYEDVEEEINNYKEFLEGKVVYCPCDTMESAFYKYFVNNFSKLQLKKLIVSSIHGNTVIVNDFGIEDSIEERVDFLSDTADRYYEQADVVITNPPFSLFRKFYDKLKAFKKDFIILGSNLGYTYINIIPDIMNNTCRWGFTKSGKMFFLVPDSYELRKGDKVIEGKKYVHIPVVWYTSFPINHGRRLDSVATYEPGKYFKYENYDAINVDKRKEIPIDYDGIMGVPCTYLDYHNPDEYKIVGIGPYKEYVLKPIPDEYAAILNRSVYYMKDGKTVIPFKRIFIQKIKR